MRGGIPGAEHRENYWGISGAEFSRPWSLVHCKHGHREVACVLRSPLFAPCGWTRLTVSILAVAGLQQSGRKLVGKVPGVEGGALSVTVALRPSANLEPQSGTLRRCVIFSAAGQPPSLTPHLRRHGAAGGGGAAAKRSEDDREKNGAGDRGCRRKSHSGRPQSWSRNRLQHCTQRGHSAFPAAGPPRPAPREPHPAAGLPPGIFLRSIPGAERRGDF